ncbi:farnesyl cysteine-carboxyl methyltransferase [Naganishia albida]|nr:farnesyl cysteine-carboxyl methyltransferase [Naganishia albida]
MSTNPPQPAQHISRPITVTLMNSERKMDDTTFISVPSPAASQVLPTPTKYRPTGTIPNTPFYASFISWSLGWIAGVTVETIFGSGRWTRCIRPQLGFYLAGWALFHVLEFWTTAACNREKLSVDAFLLNNGMQYHAAHLIGLTEYFLSAFLVNEAASANNILAFRTWWMGHGSLFVLPILFAAQALRSLAMIHAADSFSHVVSRTRDKQEGHVLVTWGVYRISRHPSYTGFFYWALSTQLLLGNPISFIGFWFVLSRFFKFRIIDEEIHLVRYFGDAYVQFRKRTGHWLPVNTTYVPPKARGGANGVPAQAAGQVDIRKTQ